MTSKMNIGYSPLTETVYLGKQNIAKGTWVGEKLNVTNEFLAIAHEYFEENVVRTVNGPDGSHLFAHIKNDPASIRSMIAYLEKRVVTMDGKKTTKKTSKAK